MERNANAGPAARFGRTKRRAAVVIASCAAAVSCFPGISAARQREQELARVGALKQLSIEELLDMEVTSVSKRPERLWSAASAVQVITGEDIRLSGAKSVPAVLRLASNLQVARINAHDWAISARGFNARTSNKLLVLIDGRSVYTPLFAGVFWEVQDVLLEDVERIEVISGPGATLWGSNAVNGVINIVTKPARHTQGAFISAGAGNELRSFAELRYGAARGEALHYRFYAKGFERGDSAFAERSGEDDWRMVQGGFRADWEISPARQLTFQGDLYEGGAGQFQQGDIDFSGGNVLARWSEQAGEHSQLQLQFYYDYTYRLIPGSIGEKLSTYDLDLQHRWSGLARHDITWGLGYRFIDDSVRNAPSVGFLPRDVTRNWLTAFIQDEMPVVAERLFLTYGTKLEHNDYSGFDVQPSLRLAWLINDEHTLWSAVSRAVRTPSRIDRELFSPSSPPFTIAGGAGFDSEKLLAYELGYRLQLQRRFSASLATFYHDYQDIRSLERIDPAQPFPVRIGNGLRGESYGAELTANYSINGNWRVRAGYTALEVRLRPKPASTDTSRGTAEANDSEEFWMLRSTHTFGEAWQLDLMYRRVGRIATRDVPAYGELNARLAWRPFPQLEAAVVGLHLLDDDHLEFATGTSRQQIERSVYGEIAWRF